MAQAPGMDIPRGPKGGGAGRRRKDKKYLTQNYDNYGSSDPTMTDAGTIPEEDKSFEELLKKVFTDNDSTNQKEFMMSPEGQTAKAIFDKHGESDKTIEQVIDLRSLFDGKKENMPEIPGGDFSDIFR